jgi:tetratricopeptide (TPR) repeat protein
MKKILFKTILFLTFTGLLSQALAQGEEDFEKAGRQHFDNAYFKAIPQKNKTMADVEFTLAEKAFQKAIEKKPQQVKAYLYLGRTYSAQKKYAAAAETYRSALVIAPQQKRSTCGWPRRLKRPEIPRAPSTLWKNCAPWKAMIAPFAL